jgi:hypothetical protein
MTALFVSLMHLKFGPVLLQLGGKIKPVDVSAEFET